MNKAELRTCRRCSESYEPQYWEGLSARILRGDGYCSSCARTIYEEEVAREEAARQLEVIRVRRRIRESCGIPSLFINKDFSAFEKGWQDKAFKVCWKYAEEFPIGKRPKGYRSLYLWSGESWGVGKTHLACSIIHRILDRWTGQGFNHLVVFLSEPELFRQIQATYSFTPEERKIRESENDILTRIIWAGLVVLDDVGKERRIDPRFIQRTIFAIIDGRYKNQLPMVITANLGPEELKEHLGAASADRLYEMTQGIQIHMDGRSYRRQN